MRLEAEERESPRVAQGLLLLLLPTISPLQGLLLLLLLPTILLGSLNKARNEEGLMHRKNHCRVLGKGLNVEMKALLVLLLV
mmetsp:Transcript_104677/g.293378  ORF Transcript_104677/g.293378 Transcript_104677/m.293378 type:complete len:82 (+) Transcript_104677:125-370(+)